MISLRRLQATHNTTFIMFPLEKPSKVIKNEIFLTVYILFNLENAYVQNEVTCAIKH